MKQVVQLGTLSATNIGLTFLFQWYVLTQLGPGPESDALFAGMTIPQFVLAIISGSLMHVLVPILTGESEERLQHDAWALITLIASLFGFLAIFLYVTAVWWIPITVPGFDETGRALTVHLTRIQLIAMVFSAVNGVQWAAYHARHQFIWAEVAPMFSSALALLALVWALPRYGVTAAAWIGTLRVTLQTFLLAPGTGRPVFPNLRSATIQKTWQRIKPLLLGTAYYKTDPLIDRFLLSTASSGTISLYYLAQQIYGAANLILNKAIAVPLVPLLSQFYKTGDLRRFKNACRRKMWQVGLISLVGLSILGLFGQLLLKLLIGHGNVSVGNISELWWIMIWLGGSFIGGALGQISASSFYAAGDTKTPTRIGIFTYTFYAPAKIFLFHFSGIMGLALITSGFLLINFMIQNYQLKKVFKLT